MKKLLQGFCGGQKAEPLWVVLRVNLVVAVVGDNNCWGAERDVS